MLVIYIDSNIGSDTNGNGTKENPYNTLQYFIVSVAEKINSNYTIRLNGTHRLNNRRMFSDFQKSTIEIIGEALSTEIIQEVPFSEANQGGFTTFNLTIARCRYNIPENLNSDNLNIYFWTWNFYNVLFEYIPNNSYSIFLPNVKTIFRNCVKLTNTTSFLRTNRVNIIDVYDSIGYFTNGYSTIQSYWDRGGNQIGTINNYMDVLKTGLYPWISNKTLILHNGEYKKYNITWQTISSSTPTVEQFISSGMNSLSPLLDRVNGISPLDDLTGDFEVITWTDEVDSNRKLDITVLQSPQLAYPTKDISLAGVSTVDSITLTATGNSKIAISFDGGLIWKAYKNGIWETVTDAHSGMTISEINTLTGIQIEEARGDSDFIRFSYYLGDENAEVDNIQLKVSMQGTEKIASTSDYTVDYDAVNKTIIYNIKKSGTYSFNYVDTK